jgi:fatty acid desaturase
MSALKSARDYRVTGPEYQLAQERALAMAQWYESPISRQRMKELMKRKDGPAIRDILIWILLLLMVFLGKLVGCSSLLRLRSDLLHHG